MSELDFYFDYSCPWCYLGSFKIRELAAEGVTIHHHVWKMPEGVTAPPKPEGYREAGQARLKELRAEMNVRLSSPVQPNTVPALLATKVADQFGAALGFVEAVFRAHWAEKKDIADRDVLVALAAEVGLDGIRFRTALEQEVGHVAFERDMQQAKELEISTIPAYLHGDKQLLIHHFDDMPTLDTLREIAK